MRTTRRRFCRGLAATLAAGLLPESAALTGEVPAARRAVRLADLPAEDRARLGADVAAGVCRELQALLAAPPAP